MKTDRSKHPKCHYCGRTLEYVNRLGYWRHKHTKQLRCTKQPKFGEHFALPKQEGGQ